MGRSEHSGDLLLLLVVCVCVRVRARIYLQQHALRKCVNIFVFLAFYCILIPQLLRAVCVCTKLNLRFSIKCQKTVKMACNNVSQHKLMFSKVHKLRGVQFTAGMERLTDWYSVHR